MFRSSSIEIIKTATPDNVDEPGGAVTYSFTVNNTSAVDSVTIDTLDDTIYGDDSCATGNDDYLYGDSGNDAIAYVCAST